MNKKILFLLVIGFILSAVQLYAQVTRDLWVHDPTTIRSMDGYYVIFSTTQGKHFGIETRYLAAGAEKWQEGNFILTDDNKPVWLNKMYPKNKEKYWAPDLPFKDKWILCYSTWSFKGVDGVASIGRATATGQLPDLKWVDDGEPVISTDEYTFDNGGPCAIDPAVFEDYDGRLWLCFGSHGKENKKNYGGIWIVELDTLTGHLGPAAKAKWIPDNRAYYHAANYGGGKYFENNIEAPFVYKHNNYYYLFVNWDRCCNGTKSDYNIRIGRSLSPTGPYLDKNGIDMFNGGGTLLLATQERFIGPGHAGIFESEDGRFCFSFHYYDKQAGGKARLGKRELIWEENWPVVTEKEFELE